MKTRMEKQVNRMVSVFTKAVMDQFGFDEIDAKRIERVYRKEKLFSFDSVAGGFTMKSGAFWEEYPMNKAVDVAKRIEHNDKMLEKEVTNSLINQINNG